MHTAPAPIAQDFAAELRRRISRAEERAKQSRTDAEFYANDELISYWQDQLRALLDRRAA